MLNVRDWVTCVSAAQGTKHTLSLDWVPLGRGKFKVNFDGASFGNPGPTGYGCVMQDSQGLVILVKGGPIGRSDATHADLIGLLEGLIMLREKGIQDCIVEGDSINVLRWGRGENGYWSCTTSCARYGS